MPANDTSLEIITLETPGLGDRSYLAAAHGWAVAIDVQRDIDRVEHLIASRGLRLAAVMETHIHNDYITGGLALARRTGAEYVVPAGPRLGYTATRAEDGATIDAGALRVGVLATPGHTDAHAVFHVSSTDTGEPDRVAAFTGGSLLVGTTGRTDLLGIDRAEALARQQYWSVRRLGRLLPAHSELFPTHGFGSFCAAGVVDGGEPTLISQMGVNPAFLLSEDEFVQRLLEGFGAYPSYYAYMGPRNAGGPEAADLTPLPRVDEAALADADRCLVDVRSRSDYANAHVAGSVHVSGTGSLATWVGWVLPIDTPITLVAGSDDEVDHAQRELCRIGFDDIRAAHVTTALDPDVVPVITTPRASLSDLSDRITTDTSPVILDVRELSEWRAGHVLGAVHIPAHQIGHVDISHLEGREVWVHCAAGFRAGVATSLLERRGIVATWVDDELATAPPELPRCSDPLCGRVCGDHARHELTATLV